MKQKTNRVHILVAILSSIILIAASALVAYESRLATPWKKAKKDIAQTNALLPQTMASQHDSKVSVSDQSSEKTVKRGDLSGIPILMYHHVGPVPPDADAIRKDLTVSIGAFESQLAWLKSERYESISLQQILNSKGDIKTLPVKPIVFTFDDSYDDVFENAVPLLQKYGFTGSFAIITGFVEAPGYATWRQIENAKEAGMEIVSHTHSHFDGNNAKYSYEYIYQDLVKSKNLIKEKLGVSTEVLIYPFGHFTQSYEQIAREIGFKMALTVHHGTYKPFKNPMETPRIRVHGLEDITIFQKNLGYPFALLK